MPIFEFHCPQCKRNWETLYKWKYDDGINYIDDPTMEECPIDPEHRVEIPAQLTAMFPDTFWKGVMTDRGYFTSEKAYKDARSRDRYGNKIELLDITSRGDREALTKHVARQDKEKEEKEEKQWMEFNAKLVQDHDFKPTTKEDHAAANEILSDKDIAEYGLTNPLVGE